MNSAGWVVGNDSSAFSIPFLYDGTNTYRLADLIPPNSGWDLSMNTSSSALASAKTASLSAQAFTMARLMRMPWSLSHPRLHLLLRPTPSLLPQPPSHGYAQTYSYAPAAAGSTPPPEPALIRNCDS